MRFAKKPMNAPCHRISDRCARRFAIVGIAAELAGLRLLPLCQAYPMNASCLVCLYYWKESKRSRAMRCGEIIACFSALGAWLLPLIDPTDGGVPEAMQIGFLVDTVLEPMACAYLATLVLLGVMARCLIRGDSAMGSSAGPALHFGLSALALKAFVNVAEIIITMPKQPEPWAALLTLSAMLISVRTFAAAPLRRALEAHDTLSVLACYGAVSSAAAVVTGCWVFGEISGWPPERQCLYGLLFAVHCWGMRSVSSSICGADPRGYSSVPNEGDDDWSSGKAVQMAENIGRSNSAGSAQGKSDSPPSPLLNFSQAKIPRSVDEDAQIEDKLLASALALQPLEGAGLEACGDMAGWATAWPSVDPQPQAGGMPAPQFEADFDELMRRFDEDDRTRTGAEVANSKGSRPVPGLGSQGNAAAAGPTSAGPSVLTSLDAQTLLECSYGGQEDEEDELLNCIQDIPGPDMPEL